ncbi:ATP phosphoribosyltransferase regulatory subunit, partial [Candidatus Dojkabacteria bacterium]|nr:ATP phosphoribosyltransferase regulatory subunit [Candidatus Dojkabacteria bacterium]
MSNKGLSTQPYKGARDFYPEDMRLQKYIFSKWEEVAERFGYEQYDFPFLESFDIYAAKTGDEIVNEQLYSFTDRGDRKVAIRPEATPSLARMVAGRLQELPTPVRWYSYPNLWRYEKPQKGRLRE